MWEFGPRVWIGLRDRYRTIDRMGFANCVVCGGPLPPRGRRGPARTYCGGSCRSRASRERHAQDADWSPATLEPAGLAGVDAVEPLPLLTGPADPVDRLAALVLGLRSLLAEADRLGPALPPSMRWRVDTVAGALTAALQPFQGALP